MPDCSAAADWSVVLQREGQSLCLSFYTFLRFDASCQQKDCCSYSIKYAFKVERKGVGVGGNTSNTCLFIQKQKVSNMARCTILTSVAAQTCHLSGQGGQEVSTVSSFPMFIVKGGQRHLTPWTIRMGTCFPKRLREQRAGSMAYSASLSFSRVNHMKNVGKEGTDLKQT